MGSSGFSYKPLKRIEIGSGQSTAFNTIQVSEITPTAQADFIYGINPTVVEGVRFAGASATGSGGYGEAHSSTSISGSGIIQLRRGLKYVAGQGALFRGTAIFDTPVAGNEQRIGAGNSVCGYYFGYKETTFGIFHDETGEVEIRKFTITAGVASTTNITVTLDGDTIVVPVAGGGDTTQTAYQLSLADYTDVGDGWLCDVVGADVYFISHRAGAYTGTFSLAGTGLTYTAERTKAGEDITQTFIPQTSWNYDKMDGTGPTGMTLDTAKGNVYEIEFQYLGQGNAFFSIENSNTGRLEVVHQIKNANLRTTPVLKNPNVSGLIMSRNTGNNTDVVVKCASMGTFIQGPFKRFDPKFSKTITFDSADTSGVYRGLLALKVNRVYRGQPCFGELDLLRVSATNTAGATSGKPFTIGIFRGSEVAADANFVEVDPISSCVSAATLSTTTGVTISPNTEPVFAFGVNGASSPAVNLVDLNIVADPGEVLIIGYRSDAGVTDNSVTVNWFEQQ